MTDQENTRHAPKRTAIYVRVSTATKSRHVEAVGYDQNPAVQEHPLRDLVAQRGWTLHKVYSDRASAERRPGLDALMAGARRGETAQNEIWLPFVDAFRTFCLHPNPEGRNLLLGIRQFGPPLSASPASLEGLRP